MIQQPIGNNTQLIDILLHRSQMAACYLIADAGQLAIIDCGTQHSVPQVMAAIADTGHCPEQVRWIIPTHVHLDHAGGAGQLMQQCPQATLVTHPNGLPHLIDPSLLQASASGVYGAAIFARDYGTLLPVSEARCQEAEDNQSFELGNRQLTYLHTPGHASHHGCILDSASRYLFTGDIFGLSYPEFATPTPHLIATTTPVGFDPDAWQASLDRLLALDIAAVCLAHFGKQAQPKQLAEQLRASIEMHREIGLQEEKNPLAGRHERLTQVLQHHIVTAASQHSGLTETQAQALLADDIDLNAQGIAVWLARRAKHRTAKNINLKAS
jgi:glyoxylase-like metal-dependent hydrolase (beta-lactamase superfamily II)